MYPILQGSTSYFPACSSRGHHVVLFHTAGDQLQIAGEANRAVQNPFTLHLISTVFHPKTRADTFIIKFLALRRHAIDSYVTESLYSRKCPHARRVCCHMRDCVPCLDRPSSTDHSRAPVRGSVFTLVRWLLFAECSQCFVRTYGYCAGGFGLRSRASLFRGGGLLCLGRCLRNKDE